MMRPRRRPASSTLAGSSAGSEVYKRRARGEAALEVVANRVAGLLGKPLTVDDAVQIALLNNRGLQAGFQELGITEAEVVQAGRLPNPGFSFRRPSPGRGREI